MQGIKRFIPTELKARYLNELLQAGFDTLDFGSYVSPAAIPQMRDTAEVLRGLRTETSPTRLLAIVANERGALEAVKQEKITYLGFPLSVSETFQQRNTNTSIQQSLANVEEIITICKEFGKEPLIYLSMAFGNPYGDPWSPEIVAIYAELLVKKGVKHLMLADTIGVSTPESIQMLYQNLNKLFPHIDLGVHLHSTPQTMLAKIQAAYNSGCQRFDTAIGGYGGCPMASDKLTGNIATEVLLSFLQERNINSQVDQTALLKARHYSSQIFHGRSN